MSEDTTFEALVAAIEDTQATIKAIDTKSEVLLVALALPLVSITPLIGGIQQLGESARGHSLAWLVTVAGYALLSAWVLAFWFCLLVLKSISSPTKGIPDANNYKGAFFSALYFRRPFWPWGKKGPGQSVVEHRQSFSDKNDVVSELTFEHLKVGVILAYKICYCNRAYSSATVAGVIGLVLCLAWCITQT